MINLQLVEESGPRRVVENLAV